MTDIYDLHTKAFDRVSAFVIVKNGERVATIAFKFPADGAGRLYAYVHWFGLEMVRGHAGGYGYDKKGGAVESAARLAIKNFDPKTDQPDADIFSRATFFRVLSDIGGDNWNTALERNGFTVWQAV